MALKSIAVGITEFDKLKLICDEWNIKISDHRFRELFEKAITENKNITGQTILDYLNEHQVKDLCRLYGISSNGRRTQLIERLIQFDRKRLPSFMAIDFETADNGRDSACAVGLVKVRGHRIVQRQYYLIRPPRQKFKYTYVHGITWEIVCNKPSFEEIWPNIEPLFSDIQFLVAHNSQVDQSVLEVCCESNDIVIPQIPFKCTMKLAHQIWNMGWPPSLKKVCDVLQIPLVQHHAASDAEACARIFIRAEAEKADI